MLNKLKLLKNYFSIILKKLLYAFPVGRKNFWEDYSKTIYDKYGNDKIDYKILQSILKKNNPKKLLDIGCGNGRLFPIYFENNINEIIGQDISKKHWI